MSKTEKQIRLCMRIMHRLVRRWYEEKGVTRDNCPYDGIRQYGSFTVGYSDRSNTPICNFTLHPTKDGYLDLYEDENVR